MTGDKLDRYRSAVKKPLLSVALLAFASVVQAGAVERKLLGRPPEEPVEPPIDIRSVEESVLRRRQLGWRIVQTVTRPTTLGETKGSVPYWSTWYTSGDFMIIFSKLITGLDGPQRMSRNGFTREEIRGGIDWFFGTLEENPTWDEDAFKKARERVSTTGGANGLAGLDNVFYSPAALNHILGQYGSIYECRKGRRENCVTTPFPSEAIVVKTRWQNGKVDVHDTDSEAIQQLLQMENPTWFSQRTVRNPDRIFTARTEDGSASFLVGLHIMIKTLPEWVWVTIWWSPEPDSDFGADRPDSMTGVWANYKMCVVIGFDENRRTDEELGESLQLVSQGPHTWCSNPYLGSGPGNGGSNCMGCHQHAGSRHHRPKDLIPQKARERQGLFGLDYVWAIQTESPLPIMDFLVNMIGPFRDRDTAQSPGP